VDLDALPVQLKPVVERLRSALRSREPALRERVERLRAENPGAGPDELARKLIRSTRARVAATGAASGAAGAFPGLGTLVSLGTAAGQSLYALEQEAELALSIALVYERELEDPDRRLLEALVVVGLAGGAVRLRDDLLVVGSQRITIATFRRLPEVWLGRAGAEVLGAVLGRTLAPQVLAAAGRAIPLAIGVVVGAGFDWVTVSLLGRAAMLYYRQTLPRSIRLPPEPTSEEPDGSGAR
jgi:hypothetical protein